LATEFKISFSSRLGKSFSDVAKKYPEDVEKQLRIGIKSGMTEIAESARNNHRFKPNPTAPNLSPHAILENFDRIDELIGIVKIDPVQASYGFRIHQGFSTWKPDPFIFNAGKREEKKVINNIFNRIKKLNL